METVRISKGGQISIPARIRKRWGVDRLALRDEGGQIVIIPVPDDPIAAVRGMFAGPGPTSEDLRRRSREEEIEAEERKLGRPDRP